MMRLIVRILALWLIFSQAEAVTVAAKNKYPYPLLTKDYNILSENDLAAYTWGMKQRPFTEKEDSGGYNYWQCFPREMISINLEDMGYSSENFGWKDTLADLKIEVWIKPGVVHRYFMRAVRLVNDYENRFHKWHKLMKGEKYVCLAGSFGRREQKTENGKELSVYSWTFDKIKTNKGCNAYWNDCNRTYQQFSQDKATVDQWKKPYV